MTMKLRRLVKRVRYLGQYYMIAWNDIVEDGIGEFDLTAFDVLLNASY